MRIVVTGGNGNVGRHVVGDLMRDHDVVVLDRAGEPVEGVTFVQGDMLDMDVCRRALRGADAVAHLGAIPHPLHEPQETVWRVNVCSTYNIHEAAVEEGVRRVVQASSDSTLGFVFMQREFAPEYLPIDEEHPCRPQDSYGLSKLVGEQIAASFTARCGLETVALRICLVLFPDLDFCRNLVRHRLANPTEKTTGLWVYNHVLDVAQAFRLALETPGLTHEVLFVSAADLCAREPTLELLGRHLPEVTDIRGDLSGNRSLINYAKATSVLGYEPEHRWTEIEG